jgi:hypothetical protein
MLVLPTFRFAAARRGRHPLSPGGHIGAPTNPHSYILEEADAVGAQFIGDKLARKLGLTCRRAFGLLLGVQKSLPTSCGNCE